MSDAVESLRLRARQAGARARGQGSAAELAQARDLVVELRNARLYPELVQLAEAVCRRLPGDARTRRLYAQAQIEQGCALAAIDQLEALARTVPRDDPESSEVAGLIGRAYKQIFIDAGDKTSEAARGALKKAIAAYRKPFEANPANTWHGVNLLSLLSRARGMGVRVTGLDFDAVAQAVSQQLRNTPAALRDEWYLPTLAEASLAVNDWAAVESALQGYVADEQARAFMIASTLRQFTQVWDVESIDERGRALVAILRARLLEVSGGGVELSPPELQRARQQVEPAPGQLEAVLGACGAKTWKWWKTGLDRASAVCSVRTRMGDRLGTGWLVRAASLNRQPGEELLVMTNFHVVNGEGAYNAIRPEAAEVVFEAVDAGKAYAVREMVWSSPPDRHDCSVLRLAEPVVGIEPLSLARDLPVVDAAAHVYVIGYPGGRELAFSLQDNALMDHEGPPSGTPAIEGLCRVHYRAPTEGGSSGSPVFNATLWEVIALHHSGGKLGVPRLNGQPGSYAANEGIAIQSIVSAMSG